LLGGAIGPRLESGLEPLSSALGIEECLEDEEPRLVLRDPVEID